ncbi:hypothetical protein ACK3TF_002706 [Chlorella vulgaris]
MELYTALFIASLPHAHANITGSMTACLLRACFSRHSEPFPRGFAQTCQPGHPAAHMIRRGQKALGPSSTAALAAKDGGMNGAGRIPSLLTIDGRLFIPVDEADSYVQAAQQLQSTVTATGTSAARSLQADQRMDGLEQEVRTMQSRMLELADVVHAEREEHERDQQAMLELATALEAEARGIAATDLHGSAVLPCSLVVAAQQDMQHAVEDAVLGAEERLVQRHDRGPAQADDGGADAERGSQASTNGQLHQMAAALRAALQGEQRWRERALVAERQFEQLRGIIAARMIEGSWEAVQARQQHQWQPQPQAQGNEGAGAASGVGVTAAPATALPLRPNCRMRGGEAGAGQEV